MNKICTSIEQSKKLIELGIDVNTADFMWEYDCNKEIYWDKPTIIPIDDYIFVNDIPAWSLSALLEFINRNCYNISLNCSGAEWTVKFDDSETYHHITCDYSIDATFEMICWLKETNRI